MAVALLVMLVFRASLLEQFGYASIWPVDVHAFLRLSNAVYLLVPVVMVTEFLIRLRRSPGHRLRRPVEFAGRARQCLPANVDEVRRG